MRDYNAGMKRAIAVLILAFVVFLTFIGASQNPDTSRNREVSGLGVRSELSSSTTTLSARSLEISEQQEWYEVVRVVDGDTIIVDIGGKNTTIRLIGLDTPETVDPRKPVQCFGREASAKAKQILSGSSVRLETDSSQDTYDKYGRTLAYVYFGANSKPEGILVNEYMIVEGYGHEYTYHLPYKYQSEFKAAEKGAREAKRGLWADDACVEHFVL